MNRQQRVSLARALIADTGLILCDEPLSNLDADLRERMRVEISSLVREAGATFRGRGYEYAIDLPGPLEPGGCHLFPADDGAATVRELAVPNEMAASRKVRPTIDWPRSLRFGELTAEAPERKCRALVARERLTSTDSQQTGS
jgi:hypothetical protein